MASIYRRTGGIYWVSFYKDGKHHCKSLKTKDRATANYLKSKLEQEITENKYIVEDTKLTCIGILQEYVKATEHYKTAKTSKDDDARVKAFLAYAGIKTLPEITEKKLQDYLNHRLNSAKDKVTLNTANRIISSIKAWLNFAVRSKYLYNNPVKDFKKFKPPKNPPKFLTKDEVGKILEAAENTRIYPAIFGALYTGMRRKELYSLEWKDVDFERDIITVENKTGFQTKSKKFRTVPLHHKLKELLLSLRQGSGKCFEETNHTHLFPKIVKKAGLGRTSLPKPVFYSNPPRCREGTANELVRLHNREVESRRTQRAQRPRREEFLYFFIFVFFVSFVILLTNWVAGDPRRPIPARRRPPSGGYRRCCRISRGASRSRSGLCRWGSRR